LPTISPALAATLNKRADASLASIFDIRISGYATDYDPDCRKRLGS
jgi:hypothetical protein